MSARIYKAFSRIEGMISKAINAPTNANYISVIHVAKYEIIKEIAKAFNRAQPRDAKGRWTKNTGATHTKSTTSNKTTPNTSKPSKKNYGYIIREGKVEFKTPPPFNDKNEAAQWVKESGLAKNVDFDGASTADVNKMLGPIRALMAAIPPVNLGQLKLVNQIGANATARGGANATDPDNMKIHIKYSQDTKWRYEEVSPKDQVKKWMQDAKKDYSEWKNALNNPNISDKDKQRYTAALKALSVAVAKAKENPETFHRSHPFAQKNMSDQYSVPAAGTLVHEIGHCIHAKYKDKIDKAFIEPQSQGGKSPQNKTTQDAMKKYSVSTYSRKSSRELFAENFAAYVGGHTDRMHPDIIKLMDDICPKIGWGKRKQRTTA